MDEKHDGEKARQTRKPPPVRHRVRDTRKLGTVGGIKGSHSFAPWGISLSKGPPPCPQIQCCGKGRARGETNKNFNIDSGGYGGVTGKQECVIWSCALNQGHEQRVGTFYTIYRWDGGDNT